MYGKESASDDGCNISRAWLYDPFKACNGQNY